VPEQGELSPRASHHKRSTESSKGDLNLAQYNYNYPFKIDSRGRTSLASHEEHIRQLIEQVLLTAQGERVNRPTFGSGINQLLFAPNSDELAAATQLLVQGALQQWLGDLIYIESVNIKNEDASLHILIQYRIKRNQKQQVAEFFKEA
jgi:uncharacterized protein